MKYHKPTLKKGQEQEPVVKVRGQSKKEEPQVKRPVQPNSTKHLPTRSIPQKVTALEKAVENLQVDTKNPQIQELLLKEIKGIKRELIEIKGHIGLESQQNDHQSHPEQHMQHYPPNTNTVNQSPQQKRQPQEYTEPQEAEHQVPNFSNHNEQARQPKLSRLEEKATHRKKVLVEPGKIQPYLKEFKLQNSSQVLPFYIGYHKRTSKPVVIKYCEESKSIEPLINIYEKLWKNIVRAKKICINKIYDLNEPLATYIAVIEYNPTSLKQISLPIGEILVDLLRAEQFFHECGLLYRNMHPSHVMMNAEKQVVLIDLKNMKRFADHKGRLLEVKGNLPEEGCDEFVSNSRLKGSQEGRKDDLESLGYLALYMLQGDLPWGIDNIVKCRCSLTLQDLYGAYPSLLQYMIFVHKMGTEETPAYNDLAKLLAQV